MTDYDEALTQLGIELFALTARCGTHGEVGKGQAFETPDISRYPREGRRLRTERLVVEGGLIYGPLSAEAKCPRCGAGLTVTSEKVAPRA